MAVHNEIKVQFPSNPDNVSLSRSIIAAFAAQLDFTLPELDEIRTATSEAVSNAIIHGYDGADGMVSLDAQLEEEKLTILVTDSGKGIPDIDQAREVQFTTRPGRYGLGFTFMEAFMDSLDVKSAPGRGTVVRMTKRPEASGRKSGTAG